MIKSLTQSKIFKGDFQGRFKARFSKQDFEESVSNSQSKSHIKTLIEHKGISRELKSTEGYVYWSVVESLRIMSVSSDEDHTQVERDRRQNHQDLQDLQNYHRSWLKLTVILRFLDLISFCRFVRFRDLVIETGL